MTAQNLREDIDAIVRNINGLFDIVEMLQKRVAELELKTENLDEPECHVSDGHIYASDKDEYRCKICGEFYR